MSIWAVGDGEAQIVGVAAIPPARTARQATRRRSWGEFRRFWAAHSISVFGDQLTLVALPVATYAETGSAVAVGVVASTEAVTAVLLGLLAGALADRLPHRPVLVGTDLARAAALLCLAAVLWGDGAALVFLVLVAVVMGVARVLHDASASAVVPLVVDDRDLVAANGRLQAAEAASTATGPALAGALMALGGPALAFVTDAVSFLASGTAVRWLRRLDRVRPAARPAGGPTIRADIVEGLRALTRDGPMLQVLVLGAALNVVAVCVEAQFIPYATEVLGIGPLGIGAYFALGGTAAVATSLLAGRHQTARGDAVVAGLGVFSAGVMVAGLFPSFMSAGLAYVSAGVGSALLITHLHSLRQRRFPVRLQGRVAMAVRTVFLGILPLPLIGGGLLAGREGPETLFVIAAAVGIGATLWGALVGLGRLREDCDRPIASGP